MKAYERLKFYQNICKIRKTVYKLSEKFNKHIRLVSQLRDAARSAKQNIIEGYSKDSAGEFLHSIKIAKGSLNEAEGDVNDCFEDRLIDKLEHENLKALFQATNYQMGRYMDSLIKLDQKGLWKKRWSLQPKSTSRNSNVTSLNRDVNLCNSQKVTSSNPNVTLQKVTLRNLPNSNLKRGSALIITLLIITVISAIGFGIGRLTIAEIKQSTRLEDSVGAESVAESGIEYGLLLYRYNHNVQLSNECTDDITCTANIPTEKDGTPKKFTFNSGNDAYFDLKIWHKNATVGGENKEVVTSTGTKPALSQDNTIQYDLTKPSSAGDIPIGGTLSIKFNFQDVNPSINKQANMGFEYITYDGNGNIVEKKLYRYEDRLWEQPIISTNATILRIKPWGDNLESYTITNTSSDSTDKLDSRYTVIESTGYFGNTKRKLRTTIDRASGALLGIFDFVLYSGEGDINLQ